VVLVPSIFPGDYEEERKRQLAKYRHEHVRPLPFHKHVGGESPVGDMIVANSGLVKVIPKVLPIFPSEGKAKRPMHNIRKTSIGPFDIVSTYTKDTFKVELYENQADKTSPVLLGRSYLFSKEEMHKKHEKVVIEAVKARSQARLALKSSLKGFQPTKATLWPGTLYHGTTQDQLPHIMSRGIKIALGTVGSVWLSSSQTLAYLRGMELSKVTGKPPAVVDVILPDEWPLEKGGDQIYLSRKDIPAVCVRPNVTR